MYLFTSLTKLQHDVQHDNVRGNCCHQQAGIQGYKHKKTNDKMLMSCATKTDNSQEQTDETVKYFGFLLYLLAWYASTRKKKEKKHFLFMTIITIA